MLAWGAARTLGETLVDRHQLTAFHRGVDRGTMPPACD